jgi:hypothetical protein
MKFNKVRHNQNFLSICIRGDETWVYYYKPETKQQFSQTKSTSRKKRETNLVKHQGHIGDIFECKGIFHQAKQLTSITTRAFYNVRRSKLAKKYLE